MTKVSFQDINVELIGASKEAIEKAENRKLFRDAMTKIGIRITQISYS